jgi:GNAT superfamily N-acetyltransferase
MMSSPEFKVVDLRDVKLAPNLVSVHEAFFREGMYRNMTFSPERTQATIEAMMLDSDTHSLYCIAPDGEIGGFFEFGFERPWMVEEVMLCINFYVVDRHRRGECSQMLMDSALKICKDRGAKLVWASSTAGFSDNGCNERAFRMFLKRNRFREVGTFLVWEPHHEQNQESGEVSSQGNL